MEDINIMVQSIPDVNPHVVKNFDARHQFENLFVFKQRSWNHWNLPCGAPVAG